MYKQVWQTRITAYQVVEGDALKWLAAHELGFDVFDIDPWGSPWEALEIINTKAIRDRIGIVCTDGALKKAAMIRSPISKSIIRATRWDSKSNHLKAWVYYHYPAACRYVLERIMSNWTIEKLAVKEHGGAGTAGTVYFAAICIKKSKIEPKPY